jgi:dolichol-phosphate mannosyltransferase
MTRALVTGATGFVGANLARRLIRDGDDVHLLVRPGSRSWRIEAIRDRVTLHEGDLASKDDVHRALRDARPTHVFHLAAFGAYSTQTNLEEMVATNVLGTAALVDACADAEVRAFVHTGSSSEYGFARTASRETDVLEPNSAYAVTKAAATHYGQFVSRSRDVHVITLRLYSIFGPFEEPTRLVPSLLTHALRGAWPPLVSPHIARDFVYVDDAVDAIVAAAAITTAPRGSVYNVCSGVQTTVGDLVDEVARLLDVRTPPDWSTMPPRAWDTDRWIGSPVRMAREVGWRAETPLRTGLEATLAWLREHGGRYGGSVSIT